MTDSNSVKAGQWWKTNTRHLKITDGEPVSREGDNDDYYRAEVPESKYDEVLYAKRMFEPGKFELVAGADDPVPEEVQE